jgi:DNA-binding response OmpR family regulator
MSVTAERVLDAGLFDAMAASLTDEEFAVLVSRAAEVQGIDPAWLLLRIHKAMFALKGAGEQPRPTQGSTEGGGIVIKPDRRNTCWVERRMVRLSRREYDLLLPLVEKAGELVPKATLIYAVWGKPESKQLVRNLTTLVGLLRKKLGPTVTIVTESGSGFWLEV